MSQFVGKFKIHMLSTLVHHNVRVTMDQDELVQRERPLTWPTSILKDLSAILQEFMSLIISFILGKKCKKFVSSVLLLLVRIDRRSIACFPFCLLNVVIHLLVVLLETKISMGGSNDYLLLHIIMLFRVLSPSYHRQCHTRHSILFVEYIGKRDIYFTTSTM